MNTPKGFVDDSIIALMRDEEVLKGLEACKTPEQCYDLVKDKVSVSLDDFVAMMAIAKELTEGLSEGLLSDDDLDTVAGGKMVDPDELAEIASTSTTSGATAAAS